MFIGGSSSMFIPSVQMCWERTAILLFVLFELWLTVLCFANEIPPSFHQDDVSKLSRQLHDSASHDVTKRDIRSLSEFTLNDFDFDPEFDSREDIPVDPGASSHDRKVIVDGAIPAAILVAQDSRNGISSDENGPDLAVIDNGMGAIDRAIAKIEEDLAHNKDNGGDGTRSLEEAEEVALYKRPNFAAWGGKRAHQQHKRPAFNAWSGKRSYSQPDRTSFEPEAYDLESDSEMVKRPSFNSWGGKKRSAQKRPSFNSWGGRKRSEYSDHFEKRPAFNAWSGKRSAYPNLSRFLEASESSNDLKNDLSPPYFGMKNALWSDADVAELVAAIQNSDEGSIQQSPTGFLSLQKRPSFNSWGGRRKRFWDDRIMRSGVRNLVAPIAQSKASDFKTTQIIVESPSMLDSLTRLLGGIQFAGTNFGSLLKTREGRQRVLMELKSLYNRMVNARNPENNIQVVEDDDDAKIKALKALDAAIASSSARQQDSWYWNQVKRPAFHAWSGKRSPFGNQKVLDDTSNPERDSYTWEHSRMKRSVGAQEPSPKISDSNLGNDKTVLSASRTTTDKETKQKDLIDDSPKSQGTDDTAQKHPEAQEQMLSSHSQSSDFLRATTIPKVGLAQYDRVGSGLDNSHLQTWDHVEKRPAFHAWSGKRGESNNNIEKNETDISSPKQPGTSSEPKTDSGNGQGYLDVTKRSALDVLEESNNMASGEEKRGRMGFHSWGGKRGFSEADKRGRLGFHSWGGKRDSGLDESLEELEKRGRLGFHSWGGKRDGSSNDALDLDEEKRGRQGFHSWGGKRDGGFGDEEKRGRLGFHSWGGKRDDGGLEEAVDELEKRGRLGFHSWGGKRDGSLDDTLDIDEEKRGRMGFHSWGGKRDGNLNDALDLDEEKRGRMGFHSWGGKRDALELDEEKRGRMGFHSWGGKRDEMSDSEELEKRGRLGFHSWGGKRDGSLDDYSEEDVEKRGRLGFHSWGGKRDGNLDNSLDEDIEKRGRLGFHSWGGKRDDSFEQSLDEDIGKRGRLGFHSWGGKRSNDFKDVIDDGLDKRGRLGFHSWGGKRDVSLDNYIDDDVDKRGRVGFHSWGGKRDGTLDTENDDAEKRGRMGFHSWGGKRDGILDAEVNENEEKRGRMGFHSWGGKRDGSFDVEDFDKRGRLGFHSWGGKRDINLEDDVVEDVDKRGRLGFHSWGGKRDAFENAFDKRGRMGFHSWGGKRDVVNNAIDGKRPVFRLWSSENFPLRKFMDMHSFMGEGEDFSPIIRYLRPSFPIVPIEEQNIQQPLLHWWRSDDNYPSSFIPLYQQSLTNDQEQIDIPLQQLDDELKETENDEQSSSASDTLPDQPQKIQKRAASEVHGVNTTLEKRRGFHSWSGKRTNENAKADHNKEVKDSSKDNEHTKNHSVDKRSTSQHDDIFTSQKHPSIQVSNEH